VSHDPAITLASIKKMDGRNKVTASTGISSLLLPMEGAAPTMEHSLFLYIRLVRIMLPRRVRPTKLYVITTFFF
jgi:hypothetical protein